MKRTGLSMMRMRDPARAAAPVGELLRDAAARRHERVLGRDEEARSRARSGERRRTGEESLTPRSPGRRYWAAARRPRCFERSIGKRAAVRSRGLATRPRPRRRRARRPAPVVRAAEPGRLHALAVVARRDGRRPCLREAGRRRRLAAHVAPRGAWSTSTYTDPSYRATGASPTTARRAVLAIELLADAHWPPPYPDRRRTAIRMLSRKSPPQPLPPHFPPGSTNRRAGSGSLPTCHPSSGSGSARRRGWSGPCRR